MHEINSQTHLIFLIQIFLYPTFLKSKKSVSDFYEAVFPVEDRLQQVTVLDNVGGQNCQGQ